jgi:riboflavin biosynthesis pyrimidine reductase
MTRPLADSDGLSFRLLNDDDAVDVDRLRALYAYPDDPRRCWVRGNAISSLDGGATLDGTSGGLGKDGDRLIFQLLRELADVIVVGAGTARTESYAGAQMNVSQRRRRQDRGQQEVPPIALVTRSGHLDRNLHVLTHTEVLPLVMTCSNAVAAARGQLGSAAEVIDCSGDDASAVDPAIVLTELANRKLYRALLEGGPALMGTFIQQNLVDELCLTLAPTLVGGDAKRIAAGNSHALTSMRRAHLICDADDYVYARYTRVG